MATNPVIRRIPRDKLLSVFKTPELVKLFEDLLYGVGSTLPANIQIVESVADAATQQINLLIGPTGSEYIPHDGITVQSALDSVRPLQSYAELRAYAGRATTVRITSRGIAGFFYLDAADTTSADDGGLTIVDASGRRWKRLHDGSISPLWFGTLGDGVVNDATAIDNWLTWLCANGGTGFVPPGTYSMGAGVSAALSASVNIIVSAEANFVAAAGFPAGSRMFLITTGTGSDHVFQWEGGQFDATNQPNSGAGESNDIFSFNAENCARCKIVLDRTTAGANWLTSGSDSHLFIGGARNIHAEIGHCLGATDAGIYISSDITGALGNSLYATGNFEKCSVGIIVKRLFETWTIEANTVDCLNGVGGSSADNNLGAIVGAGSGCRIAVNAIRTERACSLIAAQGGSVEVVSVDMGVAITGYTSTTAKALYLSGSSRITGVVTAKGVNAGCVKGSNFRAVDCDRRTLDTTNYDATDNLMVINCDDVGKAFAEDANSARNFFIVKENNVTDASVLAGTNSSMHRANPSSSGFEMDEASISLAGIRGAEALRVVKTANQVNFLNVAGAVTGAGSGVLVTATGSDADVALTLATKGTGVVLVGGAAGAEALRVTKVASGVNAVQVFGSVTGSPVQVVARGSDAAIDLTLAPKGTGNVRIGTHTANADAPITGYITIKDQAGNLRKLAVIA